ncbi:heterokaryon incompatibility protein-domain-containing protein [Apiospora arundinis]
MQQSEDNQSAMDAAQEAAQHLRAEADHPEVAPHSCSLCQSFVIDFSELEVNGGGSSSVARPDLNVPEVVEAASKGCLFFSYFLQPPEFGAVHRRWKKLEGSTHPEYHFWMEYKGADEGLELRLALHGARTKLDFDIFDLPGTKPGSECRWAYHQLPPNLVPNSNLSFARLRNWFEDCEKNHAHCRTYSNSYPFTPARLLEVTGPNDAPNVRLRVSNGPAEGAATRTQYAILSYCWGGDQPGKLTKERLASYQTDIPRDRLPQTVYDAVITTANLGFRYLWIDSLCIVQDDPDDKIAQIDKMHKIYRGASITIVAEVAPSSKLGFLQPRVEKRPCRIRTMSPATGETDVLLWPCEMRYPTGTEALHTRGWTFQETHLSTRAVVYGAREANFYCLESRIADGGLPLDQEYYMNMPPMIDPGSAVMLGKPGDEGGGRPQHPKAWIDIVNAYAIRHLTEETDKLLAISSLAEEYAARMESTGGWPASSEGHGGDYLAGMWRADLLLQLLWVIDNSIYGPGKPFQKYTGPSWSWASMPTLARAWYNGPESAEGWTFCELLEASTELYSPEGTRLGRVKAGKLRLRARRRMGLRCASVNGPPDEQHSSVDVRLCHRNPDGPKEKPWVLGLVFSPINIHQLEEFYAEGGHVFIDGQKLDGITIEGQKGHVLWLVEICHRHKSEGDEDWSGHHVSECQGIVVEAIRGVDAPAHEVCYRRIGYFDRRDYDGEFLFEEPETEFCEMTII